MLNKFALVVLILQLVRAQNGPAPNGPRGLAMKNSDNCEAVGTCKKQPDSTCSSTLGAAGCATCTAAGDTQTCLTCKNNAQFIQLDKKGCTGSCTGDGVIGDSEVDPKVCKCDSTKGYTQQGDGTCAKGGCNTKNCQTCDNKGTDRETCTACATGYYLTPTNQCIADCAVLSGYYGATENEKRVCKRCEVANCETCNEQGKCSLCKDGFYADSAGACQKCDASCKTCYGSATDCLACDAGKIMSYTTSDTTGRCIPQCTQASGAGNCETCGLTIEGAAYCSKCSQGNEYPQNGVCATKARAAPTCKDGTVENGICKVCADGFFKINGGCYSASRLPGSTVCTKAASTGGTCQTYSGEGYSIDGSGNLVECPANCGECSSSTACTTCMPGYALSGSACAKCHESCATCSGAAETCTACATGYYKVGSGNGVCTSCETDNGNIKGVKGCASCAAPSGSTGTVLCYLMKDSAAGGNDPNLSSGAIAGISVAVIVVVGGLVGFLCWWFICRGKA